MVAFKTLWDNHPGGASYPCDRTKFGNQCAIRMGVALRKSGVGLSGYRGKLCNEYADLSDHVPGHVRSAQELANVFYRSPGLLGRGVKTKLLRGTVNANMAVMENVKGVVFIANGWGSTDHIDVWDGDTKTMKGVNTSSGYYGNNGQQLYVWDLTGIA